MFLTYTVRIQPAEEGGFVVTVPALPGCVTQGETYEEALQRAYEAIEGFVEALVRVGQPVPREDHPSGPMEAHLVVDVPAAV